MSKIYIIGSLANPKIPFIANEFQAQGHKVFADWFSPGPEADGFWQEYERNRGRDFIHALKGPHAQMVFQFDRLWLGWADIGILVLPAGRSGHLELGWLLGQGKLGFILLEEADPERWDVMYGFASGVTADLDELKGWL